MKVLHEVALTNSERLFLLKYVNKEVGLATNNLNATRGKWEMFYSLQGKLRIQGNIPDVV